MKSTWFGCRKRYDFAKCIDAADYSLQRWDLFTGFLQCAYGACRQPINKMLTGGLDDGLEQKVISEQNRVKHPSNYAEAFAILTLALEEEPYDFLGMVLQELGIADKDFKGQCFTPRALSRITAEMMLQDAKPQQGRTLWLHEPACGGGAMLIEASEVLKSQGFYPWDYYWIAVDVDWKCFAMTYMQSTLLSIPVGVIWGNALTDEQWDSANTLMAVMHPPKKRQGADAEEEVVEHQSPKVPTPPVDALEITTQQLSLF